MRLCANTFAMARILLLALASVILCTWGQELPLAAECDPLACQLPDCRCSTTDIPGGLEPRDTPQFVAFTFDDAINVINIEFYRRIFDNRINKNGCPAQLTFFFKHEYTNYQLVNELYNKGHEIGLNSITHQTPQTYWTEATYDDMLNEIGYQRFQMAHFANIPFEEIKGVRIPFMQTGGNASFQMMKDVGLTYDSTWGSSHSNRGLWPYTLDYASTQDCNIPPCPTASIPGVWVHPLISWIDRSGFPCIILQACYDAPLPTDEEGWFRFMVENFERHYFGNRSPFVFNSHEWYFVAFPAVERALVRFLNMINSLEDVFMVQQSKIIDWVKNPVPINEYTSAAGVCPQVQPRICFANNCGPLFAEHNLMDYWVGTCTNCPRVFPWLGNPLGI